MNKKIITSLILAAMLTTTAAQATNYGIYVDSKACKVSIYEQTKIGWKLKGTKRCCAGRNGVTPKGETIIYKKKSYFKHDEARYNYASYFSERCAFHSTPCIDNKYDNSSLGHHRSGGCIRLAPKAAKWIYKHCKIGTKVIIR